MVRVTEVERNAEQEVYNVRFLHGIVIFPLLLVIVLSALAWMLFQNGPVGERVAAAMGMLALSLLVIWLASRSWQKVRITVLAERVVIDPGSVTLFSSIWAQRITEVAKHELLMVTSSVSTERRKTTHGSWREKVRRYNVVTSPSNQTIVRGISRRRAAADLSAQMNASLERLREPGIIEGRRGEAD